MMNICRTPLDVCRAVQTVFPESDIQGNVTEQGFELHCSLASSFPTVVIRNALDASLFSQNLQRICTQIIVQRVFQDKEVALHVEQFSLIAPLQKWQQFQRDRFTQRGKNCTETLLQYLLSFVRTGIAVYCLSVQQELEKRKWQKLLDRLNASA